MQRTRTLIVIAHARLDNGMHLTAIERPSATSPTQKAGSADVEPAFYSGRRKSTI
jgi:hypothetical protein